MIEKVVDGLCMTIVYQPVRICFTKTIFFLRLLKQQSMIRRNIIVDFGFESMYYNDIKLSQSRLQWDMWNWICRWTSEPKRRRQKQQFRRLPLSGVTSLGLRSIAKSWKDTLTDGRATITTSSLSIEWRRFVRKFVGRTDRLSRLLS